MRHFRELLLGAILSQFAISLAFAQVNQTGTGADPLSAEKAPNTTAAGQTKPPSRDARPTSQERSDVELEELRATPVPKQQSDFDTVALASAHRERAKSMDEKTSGLWQSWLVSICDGCGNQKPAKAIRQENQPARDAPTTTGSIGRRHTQGAARAVAVAHVAVHRHSSLPADLSTENIDTIRRKPNE